jgi:hypothetical protein
VPYSGWREQAAGLVDLDATPSFQEVLDVRAGRVGMVRDFLTTLSDEVLVEERDAPRFVQSRPRFTVGECLSIIVNEEWHHHRYMVRDLDAIEAKTS